MTTNKKVPTTKNNPKKGLERANDYKDMSKEAKKHEVSMNGTLGAVVYDEMAVVKTAVVTTGVYLYITETPIGITKIGTGSPIFIGVQTDDLAVTGGSTYIDDGMSKLLEEAVSVAKTSLLSGNAVESLVGRAKTAVDIGKKLNSISRQATGFSLGSGGWMSRRTFSGSDYVTFSLSTTLLPDMFHYAEGSANDIDAVISWLYKASMSKNAKETPNDDDKEAGLFGVVSTIGDIDEASGNAFTEKLGSLVSGGTAGLVNIVKNPCAIAGFKIGGEKYMITQSGFTLENFSVDLSPYKNENGSPAWARVSVTIKSLERPLVDNIGWIKKV